MVRVKICGITNLEDALLAAELGADALGFIFYPPSPRAIESDAARTIITQLPPFVTTVGVFVDEDAATVTELAALVVLDWIQLHGSEGPDYCLGLERRVIKAFRVRDESSFGEMEKYRGAVQALLLDTYKPGHVGGTGETFNWDLARRAKQYGPIILAGGLTPDNVARAIQTVQPQAVDVGSGVEAFPGKKDPDKLRAFFNAIKKKVD
ncbi:MAG: phosphoribosylanthranilate isomerase [Deltaproteobacteria bacterium]|nr:phosphoribosylanthranilate isomerase [Deltaproteobacteria bacterium]